jgi:flagellar protein FliO/FliZ
LVFVFALIVIGARLLKGSSSGGNSKAGSFLRGRERRLGVVEAASVDGRRKLILLRRDNVEHLIMTGGPVDVVVETGIQVPQQEEPSFTHPQQRYEPPEREEKEDGQVVIASDSETVAPAHEQDS